MINKSQTNDSNLYKFFWCLAESKILLCDLTQDALQAGVLSRRHEMRVITVAHHYREMTSLRLSIGISNDTITIYVVLRDTIDSYNGMSFAN